MYTICLLSLLKTLFKVLKVLLSSLSELLFCPQLLEPECSDPSEILASQS